MSRVFLVAFLIAIAVASAAIAQPHREQITVNVVEVPVWVTSLTGDAIDDLTAADFELFVNGEPQKIEYFEVVANDRIGDSAAARDELRRRRLYVLLFDLTTIPPFQMRKAREAALRFVADASPGETFAVARLDITGIHFAAPFTTDRIAIERAIRTLTASGAGDVLHLAMLESERATFDTPAAGTHELPGVGPRVASDPTRDSSAKAFLEEEDMIDPNARPRLFERAVDNLAALADSLAPLTGVKHVVILGSGRPVDDLTIEPSLPGRAAYLQRVHDRYRLAGVTLNAIDLDGPQIAWGGAAAQSGTSFAGGLLFDPQTNVRELVAGTGGTVVYNVRALRAQQSVTYLLGFRPRGPQRPQNAIRVRVKNRPFGAVVRHRQAYSIDPVAPKAVGEGLFLADVLMNDIEQNGMTVAVDVAREGSDITLVASVPGPEILGYGGKDGATMLDVFLYVFDEQQVVAWWKHVRLRVDLEAGREYLSANRYTIRQPVRLSPGRYAAKALLRVVGTDAVGFQRKDFAVP